MPIQYFCSGCGRPIEVDDEFAGRQAACPHCAHVSAVPLQSTYNAAAAVQARDANVPPIPRHGGVTPTPYPTASEPPAYPYPQPMTPSETALRRERNAKRLGNGSLAAGMLAVLVFFWFATRFMQLMISENVIQPGATRMTPEQMQRVEQIVNKNPSLLIASFAVLGLAVLGTSLGIASLSITLRGNWRGVCGTLVSGAFLLCFCLSTVLNLGGLI